MKTRPTVGDKAWEVDWCKDVPVNKTTGDAEHDKADNRLAYFTNLDEAEKYGVKIFHEDFFGVVRITPVAFTPYEELDARKYPHAGFWDHCGETIYIEDVNAFLKERSKP